MQYFSLCKNHPLYNIPSWMCKGESAVSVFICWKVAKDSCISHVFMLSHETFVWTTCPIPPKSLYSTFTITLMSHPSHFSPASPPVPTITYITFFASRAFSVEWSEPVEMIDGIDFNIVPNTLNCTRGTNTMYTCQYSAKSLRQAYTLTISTLYCGTQRGSEANATVHLQGIEMDLSSWYKYNNHLCWIYIYVTIGQGIVTIVWMCAHTLDHLLEYPFVCSYPTDAL